jgi:hypothetical protein
MTDSIRKFDPNDTGRSGLTRNQAYAACVEAIREGTATPLVLEEQYGVYAVAAARRAFDSGAAHLLDRRQEIIQALLNEMYLAPKANTRVAAGAHLLKAAVVYDIKKTDAERLQHPETRSEAAKELRELDNGLLELLIDTWILEHPHPPKVVSFVKQLVSHPSWESVMLDAGWVRR